MVKNIDNAKQGKMTNDSEINKKKSKEIKKAVEKEERAEKKIVEKAVDKIEKGRETVKEAEKEVAENISEESEELEEEKEKIKEKTEKKKERVEKTKKTEAVVNGRDLRISTKHAIAICRFIRGKEVDVAVGLLEEVAKLKRAVPMKGEIPHRRGKGMMSGRYPVKAALEFIRLLKSLKANAVANELELENVRISCKANIASRPYRRFGQGRFKRSHVEIKLVPFAVKPKKSEEGSSVSTDKHTNKKPSLKSQELNIKVEEEDEE